MTAAAKLGGVLPRTLPRFVAPKHGRCGGMARGESVQRPASAPAQLQEGSDCVGFVHANQLLRL